MGTFQTALGFPGQGMQYPGMANVLEKTSAWRFFSEASEILGYNLGALCLEGPAESLNRTVVAQPAVFVTCYALWFEFALEMNANYFVGHSLGEITALAAAGAFSFADGVRLVAKRGELMEAASKNKGGMAAIIGLDIHTVEELCKKVPLESLVQVANENSPEQVVVSGKFSGLEKVALLAKSEGARAIIPLNVSGPFHSRLMSEAALEMANFLGEIKLMTTAVPVLSGDGSTFLQDDLQEIRHKLVAQITKPVRFVSAIRTLWDLKVTNFIEIGPKPVLINLARRTQPALQFSLVTERGI